MEQCTLSQQVKPMSLDDPDMPPTQARMGKVVPNFVGESTEGVIDFHQWLGNSWGILFSHPAPFTPVCTTEMGAMAFEHEVKYLKMRVKSRNFHTFLVSIIGIQEEELQITRGFL